MVSVVVKMNRILMFLISLIIISSITLIVILFFKKRQGPNPEKYLKSVGYEIEYIDEKVVNIPDNFGEGLKEYNKLQKKQGFDLERYRGKSCVQKQFYVTSKKNSKKHIANVITYNNRLIGGDVQSLYYKQTPMELKSLT